MGKKCKRRTEADDQLTDYRDLYKNEEIDVNKSGDCKRAKKRKRHKNEDDYDNTRVQDSAVMPKDCQRDRQNESAENHSAVFTETVTSTAANCQNNRSRKHRRTSHSQLLSAEWEELRRSLPSAERIQDVKNRRKKRRRKKSCHTQMSDLEDDSALLDEEIRAQQSSRLQTGCRESDANGAEPRIRSKSGKYLQESTTFLVEDITADDGERKSFQDDVAENDNVVTKRKKRKREKKSYAHVSTTSDISEPVDGNTPFSQEEPARCKIAHPESHCTAVEQTGFQKRKKHKQVHSVCDADEKRASTSRTDAENFRKIRKRDDTNIANCVNKVVTDGGIQISPADSGDVVSKQPDATKFGQWTGVEFEEPARHSKFLRLLGGMKKSSFDVTSEREDRRQSVSANIAMSAARQESVNSALERQFEQAREQSFRKQRGAGLGFELVAANGSTARIDVGAVRSKRFNEDDD